MSKLSFCTLLLTVSVFAVGGYRVGSGHWPSGGGAIATAAAQGRAVLYWRDPDGKADYSPLEKRTGDGRAYLPVYEDGEPGLKPQKAGAKGGERKILYYRNPMGLPDTSPTPKKDSMGMAYIPVYEGEDADDGSSFKVSLDRVQRAGVRTEAAEMRHIVRPVRAPGVARLDERSLRIVSLRSDGFVEKLFVSETGRQVRAGEPLFRVYSAQIVSAEVDYRTATTYGNRGPRDEQAAVQRLKNLDVPDAVIQSLRQGASPLMSIDWPSPATGVVLEKKVIEGQMAKAGEELFRIADLSRLWVIADVPEQDLGGIDIGASATVTFRTYPTEPRTGRVTFILHEIDARTRTGKVRIELENADLRLKHEMYADVAIGSGADHLARLAVPASAVIDSGTRQVVLIERGEGRFEPRAVKLGVKGEDFVEVREGVRAGEKVVVSANFLLDAESNLKAALKGFTADKSAPADAPAEPTATTPAAPAAGHQHSTVTERGQ
jgi:Cu(I)/Ag(I) efflux system membrane fusion protein